MARVEVNYSVLRNLKLKLSLLFTFGFLWILFQVQKLLCHAADNMES